MASEHSSPRMASQYCWTTTTPKAGRVIGTSALSDSPSLFVNGYHSLESMTSHRRCSGAHVIDDEAIGMGGNERLELFRGGLANLLVQEFGFAEHEAGGFSRRRRED